MKTILLLSVLLSSALVNAQSENSFSDVTTTLNNVQPSESKVLILNNSFAQTIEFSIQDFSAEKSYSIDVFDLQGKLVFSEKNLKQSSVIWKNEAHVNGTFIYSVFMNNKVLKTGKFIVK